MCGTKRSNIEELYTEGGLRPAGKPHVQFCEGLRR